MVARALGLQRLHHAPSAAWLPLLPARGSEAASASTSSAAEASRLLQRRPTSAAGSRAPAVGPGPAQQLPCSRRSMATSSASTSGAAPAESQPPVRLSQIKGGFCRLVSLRAGVSARGEVGDLDPPHPPCPQALPPPPRMLGTGGTAAHMIAHLHTLPQDVRGRHPASRPHWGA